MFKLIFLGTLIIMTVGFLFLSIQLLRRRMKVFSISFNCTFILAILIPGLIFTYFLFVLTCMDGCYVKKYTPKWFFTMNLSTVGNLPVIQSINEVQYFHDTELSTRWEVMYKSKSQINEVQKEIENYLIGKNVQLNSKSSCYNGYWDYNEQTIIMRCKSKSRCIMIYLDDKKSHVLVRALEMD